MSKKIISFNTYLAPTMPNRYNRSPHITNEVKKWIDNGVDVIGLQEMNDFTIGPLGYIWLRFKMWRHVSVWAQVLMDGFILIEGYIFPIWVYKNTDHLEQMILQHNLVAKNGPVKKHKYYLTKSEIPTRGPGNGVVLITKRSPQSILKSNFSSDIIHAPGMVGVRTDDNTVIANVHFVPKLRNRGFIYRCVNAFNYLFKHSIDKIYTRTIGELQHQLSILRRDKNDNVILMGDFNICKKYNINTYNKLINDMGVIDTTNGIVPTYHRLGCHADQPDQIDYIFTNSQYVTPAITLRGERYINISDHYPLMAEL